MVPVQPQASTTDPPPEPVFEVDNLDSSDDDDPSYQYPQHSDSDDNSSDEDILDIVPTVEPSLNLTNTQNSLTQSNGHSQPGIQSTDISPPLPFSQPTEHLDVSNYLNVDPNAASDEDVDEDFNYLRESAFERDDPLEYREDLTVPIKEVIQLLGQPESTSLRPQTRALALPKQNAVADPSAQPTGTATAAIPPADELADVQPAPQQLPPQPPAPQPPAPQPAAPPAPCPIQPSPLPPTGQPLFGHHIFSSSPRVAFVPLPPEKLAIFHQQMNIHIQLATHVHLSLTKSMQAQTQAGRNSNSAASISDPSQNSSLQLISKCENMLNDLIAQSRLSDNYHKLAKERIRMFNEDYVKGDLMLSSAGNANGPPSSVDSLRNSVMNMELIDITENYLKNPLGNSALLQNKFEDRNIAMALNSKLHISHVDHPIGKGKLEWNVADDNLLAMVLSKYGRDFGELCRDLLPHRTTEDCQVRVKFLSSRRCADNAVKRQMLILNAPLTNDELKSIRSALASNKYGPSDDRDTWKRIQRELLPSREWSHLMKLWNWRESRKRYKARYRANKLSEQKLGKKRPRAS